MVGLLRRTWLWLALLSWPLAALPSQACPFCAMQGETLTDQVSQATMVLYGRLGVSEKPTPQFPDGTTELFIDAVVKPHDSLKDRKSLILPRSMPPTPAGMYKFLVFCDIFKGKVDPYRGLAVKANSDMARYLKGAVEHKGEKPEKRLRFFFDYLDNTELEISNDAYKEFANASYPEYRDLACKLPAERIAKWLKDTKTPTFRFGLYASMLGHCGKPEDAAMLRSMLDDEQHRISSGVDGILAGYILLQPKQGWEYLRGVLKDPSREFLFRYAALRAARFFWDYRPDVIGKKDLAAALAELLDQKDVADLAIEDFRKWQYWDLTDRILGLQKSPVYSVGVVRRAILRYALSAKDNPAAQKYVAEQRKKDAEAVKNAEELLKLDQTLNGVGKPGTVSPAPPTKPGRSQRAR